MASGRTTRAWALALGLALCLSGCGYREAMQRADAAEARKDWAAAAAEYEAALQHDPEDEAAARGLADAQRRWHAQSLSRFEKALSDGDLAAAKEALREAESAQPAAPANAIAERRLSTAHAARDADQLRVRARALEAQGKPALALRAWAQAQRVHATPAGAQALRAATDAVLAQAKAAEAAGRWVDADAARAAIEAAESKGKGASSAHAERVALRARWAAAWRAEALAHDAAGRSGPALVRAAQVAAITEDPADVQRRDAWRAPLKAAFALRAQVALTGPSARAARVESRLPPPANLDPASPVMALRGAIAPIEFSQSHTVKVKSQRYQAGVKTERNPEWIVQRDRVRDARGRRTQAEQALRDAERSAQRAEQALDKARRRHAKDARSKRRRLREALQRAREEEQRCQSAVRDAPDANRSSAQGRLDRAQRAVDDAWRALETLSDGHDDPAFERRAAKSARSQLDDAREAVARARQREADAERDLDRVTPTIETPRYAIHRYPVEAWTRVAEGALTVQITLPALEGEAMPVESVPLVARAETRDRRHDAQVPLGLNADPLRFPDTDATLTQAVDARLGKAAAQAIAAQEARWARALVTRAEAASTPAEQVRLAAAAVLVRGASKDTIHRAWTLLKVRLDLREIAALIAGPR